MENKTFLTNRFFAALTYATSAHGAQVRKSTNIPYISHPIGVASLVLEAGGSEDQAIAGLLHDVAEDCGGAWRIKEINDLFSAAVAQIVSDCTDSLVENSSDREDWQSRKEKYLEHLSTSADSSLLVSAADKAHNARSIATDLQISGNVTWQRFSVGGEPKRILWYYNSLEKIFEDRKVSPKLLLPLKTSVQIMREEVDLQ
jgi:(p)ppGpp synthase/HD superfamily hydrolase